MRVPSRQLPVAAIVLAAAAPQARAQCLESATLLASDPVPQEHFGGDVSLGADLALIGAPGSLEAPGEPGRAFLFAPAGSSWVLVQELLASDGEALDHFGSAVAIRGDLAVVGASHDDDLGTESGSAYVFRGAGSEWLPERKLLASDGAAWAHFGSSAATDGAALLVGAPQGNAAYVFQHDADAWSEQQKLAPPGGSGTTSFGSSVSIDGDVAVAGGIAIDEDSGDIWGTAHVFRQVRATWVHEQQLLVPTVWAANFFGAPVAVSGDAIVVGAWLDGASGAASGSAFIFRHDGASWSHEQTLYAPDPQANDFFGCDVAIRGDTVVIGSQGDDSAGNAAGAAFLFRHDGDAWHPVHELLASDGAELDFFGHAVSVAAGRALVGATSADPAGSDSGAAYVFACDRATRCAADVTGDGVVGIADLLEVLAAWGACREGCAADIDGDGVVGIEDLLGVLAAWGPCPA